jgi:hypothetical protein
LARWTTALLDVGVRPKELQEGYGVRYAAALQEIRTSPAGDR